MNITSQKILCFGVAGNFTGHLEQAGEAKDFEKVITKDANAPKALFPTFIPITANTGVIPSYLGVFPFSSEFIAYPSATEAQSDQFNLQVESECGIFFKVNWSEEDKDGVKKALSLEPEGFCASNDCSIRREGAKKISEKKNWGKNTKGASTQIIPLAKFESGCVLDNFRIASFVKRNGTVYEYGEDSPIKSYSYFYKKLEQWLLDRLNNQQNEGPAENLSAYIKESGYAEEIFVSVGATRYTEWGEKNFLIVNDEIFIVLYDETVIQKTALVKAVTEDNFEELLNGCSEKNQSLSILKQTVI